jgi:hypothetical protein
MAPQGSAGIAGTWDMTVESPQGKRTSTLVIASAGDKLTAVIKSERGDRALDSVAVKGDEITMIMKLQFGGQDMVITYKGKAEKGAMKGDADFGGMATGTWTAVPHAEAAPGAPSAASSKPPASPAAPAASNLTGVWDFVVESEMGTGAPVFDLKQDGEKVSGTYKGLLGEAPVAGTVTGSDLKLVFRINAQGQDMEVTYTGKIAGPGSMKGKVSLGGLGEGTWTAKKK